MVLRVKAFSIVPIVLCLICCVNCTGPKTPELERSFHFCLLGDMPYYLPVDYERFDNVIEAVNREKPAFTVHVGDTKSGGSPCSNATVQRTWDSFSKFDHPLIYTPGDNEWTDCHRKAAGSMDPLERLSVIRDRFFGSSSSLGGGAPIEMSIQSADTKWRDYPENRMWIREGVVFATLHIVGSHNNNQPDVPRAVEEFVARDKANEAWLENVFAKARSLDAPGLAIFIHANPFGELGRDWDPGFARFLGQLRELTIAFNKPVLVSHGDSHYFRVDKPLMHEGTARDSIENLTRLEVFGARNMHGVRVEVDPKSEQVFRISQLIVKANRR